MPAQEVGRFVCPRTSRPDLVDATRRALRLGPADPVPRCWSWSCPGCSHLKSWGVRRYVKLGALEAAGRGDGVLFVTLTEPGSFRSWSSSSTALSQMWRAEHAVVKRAGSHLRWVAVPELQKRGAVHWHLLVSLPVEVRSQTSLASKRSLRARAVAYGFGHQDDLQEVPRTAIGARAGYLAKYLVKDQLVADSVDERFRRVRSSRAPVRWCEWGTVQDCVRSWREADQQLRDRVHLLSKAA
jgi:hypothetical protein